MADKKKKEPFNAKKWFKTNWKMVVIVLLLLFSFNKCTTSCSSKQEVKKLNTNIEVQDSIIALQAHDIEILQIENGNLKDKVNTEMSHNTNITGIATNNQKEMSGKIDALTKENRQLKAEIKKLKENNGR